MQAAIQAVLQEGAQATDARTGWPLFAFRLHQFLSKGDTVYVSLEPEAERHITSQKQVSAPGHREKILLPLDASGEEPALGVHRHIADQLTDPAARRRAAGRSRAALADLDALIGDSAWWHENWIDDTLRSAAERFDAACDRWRQLYRGALAEQREQNRRVLDNSIDPGKRKQAQARRMDAENQLRLLRNEDSEAQFSDFYSYRYFASEGFLPGYSFPRLPLAAYVPGQRQRGAYIQRQLDSLAIWIAGASSAA